MSTTKPGVNFVMDPQLLKRIEDYHHQHHFPTRASSIKFLIAWALKKNPKPTSDDLVACQWQRHPPKKGGKR